MIQESGRFGYDDHLDAFYDYEGYGQHRIQQENGRFSAYGYVSYFGVMALEELMSEDPAEAYQAQQGVLACREKGVDYREKIIVYQHTAEIENYVFDHCVGWVVNGSSKLAKFMLI